MIAITGATGALNGASLEHLLQEVAPGELVAVVRDPARAQHLADRGVVVRQGDYADPATLPDAFGGADQLLLVSSNDPGADAGALHAAAIDAAVEAEVGRVLYTSHQGAAPDTQFKPGRDHAATEQLLAASGLPWTSLRNGFYLHTLGWLLGPWRETGVFRVPADGPVSWTSRDDAAEGAAAVLLSERTFDGPTTLTADAAPTFADLAATASEVTGRPVALEVVDAEEWVGDQVAGGAPEPMARFTLGLFQAAKSGFFAGTGPLLTELLGHRPRGVREELEQAPVDA